jgi:hypothetical protein
MVLLSLNGVSGLRTIRAKLALCSTAHPEIPIKLPDCIDQLILTRPINTLHQPSYSQQFNTVQGLPLDFPTSYISTWR